MPKIAVDKDCKPLAGKNDIGLTRQACIACAKRANTCPAQGLPKELLGVVSWLRTLDMISETCSGVRAGDCRTGVVVMRSALLLYGGVRKRLRQAQC